MLSDHNHVAGQRGSWEWNRRVIEGLNPFEHGGPLSKYKPRGYPKVATNERRKAERERELAFKPADCLSFFGR